MAITNTYQQPSTYQPGYAPQWFVALSNQTSSANFSYTVVCTDDATSESVTYQIEPRPSDNLMVFDAQNFTKNFFSHYVPNNVYGWQDCTDSIRKVKVNIGETYGTTPTYASGSDITFYSWNGALSFLDYPDYNLNDFVYNSSTANYVALSSFNYPNSSSWLMGETNKAFSGTSRYLYSLSNYTVNPPEFVRINTRDASGTLIGTSDIYNPSYGSPTYTNSYQCIDIGLKGLSNIASGLVTGTYPIITSSVASYDVIVGYNAPPETQTIAYGRFQVACEPRYTNYTLHYLDKDGNFETVNFAKNSETTVTSDKTSFRKNPYVMSSNQWVYDTFTASEVTLNSSSKTSLRLNSDWYEDYQIEVFKQLINSPRVYLDTSSGLIPIKVNTNTYLVNKKFNNKLWSLTIDVEYTHKDIWQNG